MTSELRERCIHLMMNMRKLKPPFGIEAGLPQGEMMTLHKIAFMQFHAEQKLPEDMDFSVSDIQEQLNISKPAVSQTLNSLEKKGLVKREISREDRRRITVRLTPEGNGRLLEFRRRADLMIDRIIERVGVAEMREFLDRCDNLMRISLEVREEFERGEMNIETDD